MHGRYARAMSPRLVEAAGPAIAALRLGLGDATLRRLVAAWFTIIAGKWALLVATLVIAYEVGGAGAVAVLSVVRFLTPAIVAPFAGLPAARWPALSVLRLTNALRTVAALGAVLAVAIDAPFAVLALIVGLEAGVGAFSRPLHMGLMPSACRTPEQLIAANVASSAGEGLGTFVGPALAGILLVGTGPIGALVAVVLIYAVGLLAIARTHIPEVGREHGDAGARAVVTEMFLSVRAVAALPGPRLVFLSFGLQTFVRGMLTVLVVVASIELLGLGDPGVGTLNAAMGLGGLVGAAISIALAGSERLGPAFAAALAGWGAPIAVMGVVVNPAVAVAAMFAIGTSNALLDVSGFTLVQRTTPNAARVSVLGLIDGIANLGPALGGIAASVLIAGLGTQGALVATGAVLPLAAIVVGIAVRDLDEGGPAVARRTELLRAQPLFAPLSLATVEHLAARLEPITAEEGSWLIRQGEAGDRYLLFDSGEVEVLRGEQAIGRLGPGAGAGEIALLRNVPRTASVRALSPVEAFSLDRDAFLEAVTGHGASRAAAESMAEARLAADAGRSH
jgi:hypothetical protein